MNDLPLYFAEVPDPRGRSNAQRHSFLEILLMALCAVLAGAETFVDMESFAVEKQAWLRERLGLKLRGGIPSHDTFGRVFSLLCPDAFSRAMQQWTQALHQYTKGEIIALDGKTLRRSFDSATGKGALHVVNAWANSARLVLGQCRVEGKSNEITAVPTLLAMLDVRGCIITCDALNTQKGLAAQVRAQGGDYVLALKENHALLHEEVRDYFAWCQSQPGGLVKRCDSSANQTGWEHGRHEIRRCFVVAANEEDWPRAREQWPGLQSLVLLETQRREVVGDSARVNPASVEQRFYLSSLAPDAQALLKAVRAHWGVENSGHWSLDVSFDEDGCRVRKDHAPFNLAVLRRLALNLLRQESTGKNGIKARRLRAAWNGDYLLRLLCCAKS
jgi:predicted transposase YbfD/YdcC